MNEKRFIFELLRNNYYQIIKEDDDSFRRLSPNEVVDCLNEQQAIIKGLERKLQICSAHLLSDECCLTDGQIRKIIKEMEQE